MVLSGCLVDAPGTIETELFESPASLGADLEEMPPLQIRPQYQDPVPPGQSHEQIIVGEHAAA